MCVFGLFLAFIIVFISLLFILFLTVYRKTNFFVNLYWDNKYSDSDSEMEHHRFRNEEMTVRFTLFKVFQI